MDEPTAALAVAETRKVLQLTRKLAERTRLRGRADQPTTLPMSSRSPTAWSSSAAAAESLERRREETNPEEIVSPLTGAHPDVRALEQNNQ